MNLSAETPTDEYLEQQDRVARTKLVALGMSLADADEAVADVRAQQGISVHGGGFHEVYGPGDSLVAYLTGDPDGSLWIYLPGTDEFTVGRKF